jgi:hypothetical protein
MFQVIVYVTLSFLVGLLGIGKRGGFFLHFVLSLLLTPLVGTILLLLSPEKVAQVKKLQGQ